MIQEEDEEEDDSFDNKQTSQKNKVRPSNFGNMAVKMGVR